MLRVLIVGLVLLVGAMVWVTRFKQDLPAPEVATVLPQPLALPAFRLIDDSGEAFPESALKGHFSLMFFGFTHCPDVCPITLQGLANARAELSARGEQAPQVVFVSVDPNRDTPRRIAAYLSNFDPDFVGVTAEQAALEPLLKALGVTVQTEELPGQSAYNVTHNSTVYLIGPEAELIAVFGAPHEASAINTDYLRIRQRYLSNLPRAPAS